MVDWSFQEECLHIMQDNVDECRARLLKIAGNTKKNRATVEKNIVCSDGLTYDYSFGESE